MSKESPFRIKVGVCDAGHVVQCSNFQLFGTGRTLKDAIADFCQYLIADYRAYAEADDATLDSHALELARRYRKIGKSGTEPGRRV